MSPEMQALYRHTISDPQLNAMFRQRATENAANLIANLFDGTPLDQLEQAESVIDNINRCLPRGKSLTDTAKTAIRGLVGQKIDYPSSSGLSDEQIAQLKKPKTFPEIREALQAVLRGRQLTIPELAQMSVFNRLKKANRNEMIRQNLYKMERDGQAERVGKQGRSAIWRLS